MKPFIKDGPLGLTGVQPFSHMTRRFQNISGEQGVNLCGMSLYHGLFQGPVSIPSYKTPQINILRMKVKLGKDGMDNAIFINTGTEPCP